MINFTMLVHNRSVLTKQSIDSLLCNLRDYNLTIVDDKSEQETARLLDSYHQPGKVLVYHNEESVGTGEARNEVIKISEGAFGRGDYLYLSDNDVFFTSAWLDTLIEAYECAHDLGFRILAAYNHPFNPPYRKYPFYSSLLHRTLEIGECHAVAMQSWLLKWETWDKYGPFDKTPIGKVRMSEDFAFCQKLRQDGFKVGTMVPPLIYNTSRSDSFGELIPGHDLVPDIPGVIVQ